VAPQELTPSADFIKTIEIAAPADRIWKVMTDVAQWPGWTASVTTVKRLDAGPFDVGSRARVKQPKLLPAVWSVTAFDAGRSFTWMSRMPGLRILGSHRVESIGDRSRVTLSIGFTGVLSGFAIRAFRKLNEEYLNMEAMGLKRRCESANKS
jgi:uncharacterized membrane protein